MILRIFQKEERKGKGANRRFFSFH